MLVRPVHHGGKRRCQRLATAIKTQYLERAPEIPFAHKHSRIFLKKKGVWQWQQQATARSAISPQDS